jgi:hypothetical protein
MRRRPRYAAPLPYMAVLLVLTVLTLASSRRAGAQEAKPADLDSATMAAIAPIVQQAGAANLPLELLYAKAREGQVQRAPVARIEAAVRALAARLQAANDALAPNATAQELGAAADALKAGVPRETLREMRRAGRDGSLAVPIGVLTQLVLRGVPVEKASVQVVDLLQRGAVANHFIALDERVRADVLAGKRPDESLDLRLKGIIPNLPQQATADGAAIQATTPRRPR